MDHSSVSWEITLQYFFSWNCTWFGQKEPIKVQDFRLLTAHIKFHQICTWIDSFCWKYIKIVCHYPGHWSKIWRKTDLLFQKWQEFGEFWPKHSKVSKICTFIGSYFAKYLVIWKMTWGIWQIFTRALESVKIGTLMGSFCPKWKMYELKIYRGVIYMLWQWRMMQNLKRN